VSEDVRIRLGNATGQYTKEQLLKRVRTWGLTNHRGKPLTAQAIGMLLRNQLYAGIVDVPEYGVRDKRGDFESLISQDLFYRVQGILSGRIPNTAPRKRADPVFPLRGFVRCQSCGRGLTGSWSKGRSEYYAYYHCRPGCRAVNMAKAKLESLFADELALLQRTPGYMRLLKDSVLQIWKARKAAVREELANVERAAKAIQEKRNWTGWTKRSCSNARSTSGPTTVTPRSCASSSRSFGWSVTPASSKSSTWKASCHSLNGFCHAPPISGYRLHSINGSGSNICSFRTESRSTEIGLLEPA
jgi:hypothetical protein